MLNQERRRPMPLQDQALEYVETQRQRTVAEIVDTKSQLDMLLKRLDWLEQERQAILNQTADRS